MKLLDDLKHLSTIIEDTAVAREALSKALTGRVLPDPKQDKEKPDAKR